MPDTREQTAALIGAYYAAFNAMDVEAILACLDDDVAHDINQGDREVGKAAFRAFLGRMDHRLALVPGVDEFAAALVVIRVDLGVLDHLLDVGVR